MTAQVVSYLSSNPETRREQLRAWRDSRWVRARIENDLIENGPILAITRDQSVTQLLAERLGIDVNFIVPVLSNMIKAEWVRVTHRGDKIVGLSSLVTSKPTAVYGPTRVNRYPQTIERRPEPKAKLGVMPTAPPRKRVKRTRRSTSGKGVARQLALLAAIAERPEHTLLDAPSAALNLALPESLRLPSHNNLWPTINHLVQRGLVEQKIVGMHREWIRVTSAGLELLGAHQGSMSSS